MSVAKDQVWIFAFTEDRLRSLVVFKRPWPRSGSATRGEVDADVADLLSRLTPRGPRWNIRVKGMPIVRLSAGPPANSPPVIAKMGFEIALIPADDFLYLVWASAPDDGAVPIMNETLATLQVAPGTIAAAAHFDEPGEWSSRYFRGQLIGYGLAAALTGLIALFVRGRHRAFHERKKQP